MQTSVNGKIALLFSARPDTQNHGQQMDRGDEDCQTRQRWEVLVCFQSLGVHHTLVLVWHKNKRINAACKSLTSKNDWNDVLFRGKQKKSMNCWRNFAPILDCVRQDRHCKTGVEREKSYWSYIMACSPWYHAANASRHCETLAMPAKVAVRSRLQMIMSGLNCWIQENKPPRIERIEWKEQMEDTLLNRYDSVRSSEHLPVGLALLAPR